MQISIITFETIFETIVVETSDINSSFERGIVKIATIYTNYNITCIKTVDVISFACHGG